MGTRNKNNGSTNLRAAARCRWEDIVWSALMEDVKMFGP